VTKDEALDLALETLESIQAAYPCETVGKRITAIKQARSAPEEPVYHLRQFGDVTKEQLDRYMATGDINPQPAPVQEPVKVGRITDNIKGMVLRQEVMLYTNDYLPIGTAIYTTPPAAQRQWVGLTDEDWKELHLTTNARTYGPAIEAKLKEKNT
jgi:hypothetical protein